MTNINKYQDSVDAGKSLAVNLGLVQDQGFSLNSKLEKNNIAKKAVEKFLSLGLPTNKWEDWKYTNLPNFIPENLKVALLSEKAESNFQLPYIDDITNDFKNASFLYFHNGRYQSERVQIHSGIEVIQGEQGGINWEEELDSTSNPFTLLNFGLHASQDYSQVIGLRFAENYNEEESPVFIVHSFDNSHEVTPSLLHIEACKHSNANVIECFLGKQEEITENLSVHTTFLNAHENSNLTHIKVSLINAGALHIGQVTANISQDAIVNNFTMNLSGKMNRHDLNFRLNGKNAHCQVDGLYATKDSEHVDNFSFIDHRVANTTSAQLFKGVLDDKSRAVFTGKVQIERDAQQVDAEQLNKNILLDKRARINTRPQLEVYADDVKCAHGATIGQISEEEIFYLESRGISKEKAYNMLCHAFVADVIMRLEKPKLEKWLLKILFNNFDRFEKVSS